MNIALLGDFSDNLDEGYKNTSHYLAAALERSHTVSRINTKTLNVRNLGLSIRTVQPHIIHAITQPTMASLAVARWLKLAHRRSRVVISALRADRLFLDGAVTRRQRLLFRGVRPDLVLDQNPDTLALFAKLGCRARRLPNGVNLNRFKPVDEGRKHELRRQYGLSPEHPVVLHVGHLEPQRNLLALASLPAATVQVLVAGSLCNGHHPHLITQLRSAGLHVLEGFQPRVEELYALADSYVFPVMPGDSLTMPLSVLEAMATNLPVVTTRFAGLVDAFQEGQGLRYIDGTWQVAEAVRESLRSAATVATRRLVEPYSWDSIADQLVTHYEGLLEH